MAKIDTPISDIYERIMSTQMSTADILATLRTAEGATTKARASTPEDRKRWADQKKRQRGMSTEPDSAAIPSFESNDKNEAVEGRKSASNVHVDKLSRSKGSRIPADWSPTDDDVAYGEKLHLTREEVLRLGEDMRLWAVANCNRAVARKDNWTLTFYGWMRREASKVIRQNPNPNRPGGGANAQRTDDRPRSAAASILAAARRRSGAGGVQDGARGGGADQVLPAGRLEPGGREGPGGRPEDAGDPGGGDAPR